MADLSGGVQEVNMAEEGETFEDIQQAVLRRRDKAAENLTKAEKAMKARYDRGRKVANQYQVGDLVLWREANTCSGEKGVNRKLLNKYGGPYRVSKVLGNDRYQLSAVKGMRGYRNFSATVAVDSLRRYHSTVPGEEAGEPGDNGDEAVTDRQDLIDLLES